MICSNYFLGKIGLADEKVTKIHNISIFSPFIWLSILFIWAAGA